MFFLYFSRKIEIWKKLIYNGCTGTVKGLFQSIQGWFFCIRLNSKCKSCIQNKIQRFFSNQIKKKPNTTSANAPSNKETSNDHNKIQTNTTILKGIGDRCTNETRTFCLLEAYFPRLLLYYIFDKPQNFIRKNLVVICNGNGDRVSVLYMFRFLGRFRNVTVLRTDVRIRLPLLGGWISARWRQVWPRKVRLLSAKSVDADFLVVGVSVFSGGENFRSGCSGAMNG